MNLRIKAILLLVLTLLFGVGIGWFIGSQVSFDKANVCAEAKVYGTKVGVEVVDTGETFTFDLDDPLTRVIFYQGEGVALRISSGDWMECKWQVVLGQEDKPYNGKGDSADVILKIRKFLDGAVNFEVACLGSYIKRVYYNNQLKLDTSTGNQYAAWAG